MTQPKSTTPRHLIWLLAILLAWVGPAALAHELDHALEKHQELCALHLYVGHHDGLVTVSGDAPVPPVALRSIASRNHSFISSTRPAPYAVRAPPYS